MINLIGLDLIILEYHIVSSSLFFLLMVILFVQTCEPAGGRNFVEIHVCRNT